LYEWLVALKTCLAFVFLSIASWCDYKYREVPDTVWILFAPSGLVLSLSHIVLTQAYSLIITLLTSLLIISGVSIILFYVGAFGGADAKALICLSITLPFPPISLKPLLGVNAPLFVWSIFDNALLVSSLSSVFLLVYNILWRVKTRVRLFEGLGHESFYKKLLAMITGYKVDLSKFKKDSHLIPLEEISESEDGAVTRRLKVFAKIDSDVNATNIEKFSGKLDSGVWVTPGLPFVIFITIGLVASLFFGDLIIWLATRLLSL
jgi:preflagellin peptidase FlaK